MPEETKEHSYALLPSPLVGTRPELDSRLEAKIDDTLVESVLATIVRGLAERGWGLVCVERPGLLELVRVMLERVGEESKRPPLVIYRSSSLNGPQPCETLAGLVRAGAVVHDVDALAEPSKPVPTWTAVREAAVCTAGLHACFFVGGGRAVLETAALLRFHRPRVPMFALGVTGGAARVMLGGAPLKPGLQDSAALDELSKPNSRAHRLVMHGNAAAFAGDRHKQVGEYLDGTDVASLVCASLELASRRMAQTEPDFEALQLWLGGDQRAGTTLFRKYFDSIDRYFRSRVRAKDREDLVQNVFESVTKTAASFRGDCTFRSHVYRLARRALADHYRNLRADFDPLTHSVVDVMGIGPESALSSVARHRTLIRCIEQLSVADRDLLELYYWEGTSSSELASTYGIQPVTVRWRVRAVRERLVKAYNQQRADGVDLVSESDIRAWLDEIEQVMTRGPADEDDATDEG